jgi:ubiquinone/menaquinone biosynthesis C-methylase UbiE
MPGDDARLAGRLAALLQLECSSRVLDVGCGEGAAAVHLAWSLGCRVVGVDSSESNVEAARRGAEEKGVDSLCSFVRSDADRIDVGDGRIDAVICELPLGSFDNQAGALQELVGHLRPGGRMAVAQADGSDLVQAAAALRSAGLEPGPPESGAEHAIIVAQLRRAAPPER